MSRRLLVLALAAGVTSVAPAEAAPKAALTKTKAIAKAKPKKVATKTKHKKAKPVSRTPTKLSLSRTDNMPRGYAWPPTKQMRAAETACEAKLDELGVDHKPAKSEGRIVDAMTIADAAGGMTLGGIAYVSAWRQGPQKLDCQLALALERFGHDLYDLGVRQIKFGSIYRFTNVRVGGQTKNILSRHALGIAMDIVAFIDDAGREANVKQDYPQADPLLLAIETAVNDSGKFRILLTPKNDPISHSDHFHIEVAVDYTAAP
jgi:hypothetical protein